MKHSVLCLVALMVLPVALAEDVTSYTIEPGEYETESDRYRLYYTMTEQASVYEGLYSFERNPYSLAAALCKPPYGSWSIWEEANAIRITKPGYSYKLRIVMKVGSVYVSPEDYGYIEDKNRWLIRGLLANVENCHCWPSPSCPQPSMMFDHNDPNMYAWQPITIDGHHSLELIYYHYLGSEPSGSVHCSPANYEKVVVYLISLDEVWYGSNGWYEYCEISFVNMADNLREEFLNSLHIEPLGGNGSTDAAEYGGFVENPWAS